VKALHQPASWRARTHFIAIISALLVVASACGSSATETEATSSPQTSTLRIGAIPDQEPERLQRTYGLLADYLESELPDTTVEYVPVTDYQATINAFRVGDLDVVWFGGLTGVQARLEVDGANAIAQRDIDESFTSVFIANTSAGIEPIADVAGLEALAGHSFTFGSESSTSGRLMPQSFMNKAGLDIESSFEGEVGFSGSHDATIEVVSAGTFQTGALNSQVWDDRVTEGVVDTSKVVEIFRTPTYFDYHWIAQPSLDESFGGGFEAKFINSLTSLDADNPDHADILELFGAGSFITTSNENYAAIEAVGRDVGLIR